MAGSRSALPRARRRGLRTPAEIVEVSTVTKQPSKLSGRTSCEDRPLPGFSSLHLSNTLYLSRIPILEGNFVQSLHAREGAPGCPQPLHPSLRTDILTPGAGPGLGTGQE